MLANSIDFLKAIVDGFAPDPPMTVSEWADAYRFLSQKASAEPGRWRTERTPYLKEIMDELSPSRSTEEVVFVKGAQVGGTECGNNWLGYVIDYAPGPMLAVQPTVDMAKRNSKTRLDPLIEECPRLREKLPPARSKDSDNTVLQKSFPGGVLVLAGANSAAGLRSMPARYLFLDEVDAYPGDIEGEGDPIALARARTRTFSKRKIFMVSTPTIEATSRIWREWLRSDQRKFKVPCPHCGHKQEISWPRIKWPENKPEEAALVCEECATYIEERFKTQMLAGGEWEAQNPDSHISGFHLSSLYSPVGWFSWAEAARQFMDAGKNIEALKSFVNTILGEPWRDKGEAPDHMKLYRRREDYSLGVVNKKALVLTAGVDVQKDRLEVEVVGWGRRMENWSVDYIVIPGDTSSNEVWNELERVLNKDWQHELGGTLRVRRMAVDSGYNTQRVYDWVRTQSPDRVMAVKGTDSLHALLAIPRPVDIKISGKVIKRGVKVWAVGTPLAKQELYGWLKQDEPVDGEELPIGWSHFPQYDENYFKGLTSEQLVLKVIGTRQKYVWEKYFDRNEPLDCRIYARCALSSVGVERWQERDWLAVQGQLDIVVMENKPKNEEKHDLANNGTIKRKKSSYWE
jgi:phage terminase large subunit GpA-like protein